MLTVKSLEARYGDFQALFGVGLSVDAGESVALIGANGAGKSTLLKSIAGVHQVRQDSIFFDGMPVGGKPAADMVKLGVALVPEGRGIFSSLTVEENLRIGGFSRRSGPWSLDRVFSIFPVLKERRRSSAIDLSGGQQQMIAIGRALMSNPRLLLCDEISLGLAPTIVRDIYSVFPEIVKDGLGVIIVEQNIETALRAADRAYCMMHGRISLEGRCQDLTRSEISAAYFGLEGLEP